MIKKIKPKLAIAYYCNSEGEQDSEVYVSNDDYSVSEFIKYFKSQYDWDLKYEDINNIYPLDKAWDIENEYNITIKLK